jgi:hypothetical protein
MHFTNKKIQKSFICRLIDDTLDTKVYEYFITGEVADPNNRILVLFEKYDVTIKKVTTPENPYEPDVLENLLVIPLTTNYTSFAAIENQLCRNKNRELSNNKKKVYYRDLIHCFIIDLYVNNAFRYCSDILSIKAALEYVPLMKGIVFMTLYEYYNDFLNHAQLKTEVNTHQFEDVYLNYSRFLANPENEKLFLKSSWFAGSVNSKEKSDLDAHIFKAEKTYLDYIGKGKSKRPRFSVKAPLNIRNVLKRYGVLDVLRLTLPGPIATTFSIAVPLLIFFILFDVAHYNYHQPENIGALNGFWCNFSKYGLLVSILLFSCISLLVFFSLTIRFHLKVVPGIFLPRLVIAIVSGWVLFLTGEELMKIDLDISAGNLCWLFAVVTIITVVFMAFEINNYAPAMGLRKVLGRSLLVCSIGFIVSYAFGFWIMSYVTKKFMSIDNYLANKTEIKQKFDNRISNVDAFLTKLDNIQTLKAKLNHFKSFSLEKDNVLIADSASQKRLVDIASTLAYDTARDASTLIDEFSNLARKSYISKSGEDLFWRQLAMFPHFRANKTNYYAKTYTWPGGAITTFPNMLLARALLALFIGIFFQLIIQDKSITEPI